MLPPFIIEQIRERERTQQEERVQPRVELPYPKLPPRESQESEDVDRGVVIIDVMGE